MVPSFIKNRVSLKYFVTDCRISKTSASNLDTRSPDTRSLEKELHQMIAKGLIDSSYKIVNNINLKLNVETTSKDTLSNNDVE